MWFLCSDPVQHGVRARISSSPRTRGARAAAPRRPSPFPARRPRAILPPTHRSPQRRWWRCRRLTFAAAALSARRPASHPPPPVPCLPLSGASRLSIRPPPILPPAGVGSALATALAPPQTPLANSSHRASLSAASSLTRTLALLTSTLVSAPPAAVPATLPLPSLFAAEPLICATAHPSLVRRHRGFLLCD